jgi:hypothetical protein
MEQPGTSKFGRIDTIPILGAHPQTRQRLAFLQSQSYLREMRRAASDQKDLHLLQTYLSAGWGNKPFWVFDQSRKAMKLPENQKPSKNEPKHISRK